MSHLKFDPIVVTTTSDDETVLASIAEQLVEKKLAACVQISGPVTSYYRWQGKIESSQEWKCVIKASRHCYAKLETEILRIHNYDQPQLIAVEITEGLQSYLDWMDSNIDGLDS